VNDARGISHKGITVSTFRTTGLWNNDREKLLHSGSTLASLLRFVGIVTLCIGAIAALTVITGNFMGIIVGTLMALQGFIFMVAATFVESLAASVGMLVGRASRTQDGTPEPNGPETKE